MVTAARRGLVRSGPAAHPAVVATRRVRPGNPPDRGALRRSRAMQPTGATPKPTMQSERGTERMRWPGPIRSAMHATASRRDRTYEDLTEEAAGRRLGGRPADSSAGGSTRRRIPSPILDSGRSPAAVEPATAPGPVVSMTERPRSGAPAPAVCGPACMVPVKVENRCFPFGVITGDHVDRSSGADRSRSRPGSDRPEPRWWRSGSPSESRPRRRRRCGPDLYLCASS